MEQIIDLVLPKVSGRYPQKRTVYWQIITGATGVAQEFTMQPSNNMAIPYRANLRRLACMPVVQAATGARRTPAWFYMKLRASAASNSIHASNLGTTTLDVTAADLNYEVMCVGGSGSPQAVREWDKGEILMLENDVYRIEVFVVDNLAAADIIQCRLEIAIEEVLDSVQV